MSGRQRRRTLWPGAKGNAEDIFERASDDVHAPDAVVDEDTSATSTATVEVVARDFRT